MAYLMNIAKKGRVWKTLKETIILKPISTFCHANFPCYSAFKTKTKNYDPNRVKSK